MLMVQKMCNSVSGVSEARVNLLKNSMEVDYDGNPDTLKQISDAVHLRDVRKVHMHRT